MSKTVVHIKRENRGKFTEYCKRKGYPGVTQECINEAKKSPNVIVRKRAIFAENAKNWK